MGPLIIILWTLTNYAKSSPDTGAWKPRLSNEQLEFHTSSSKKTNKKDAAATVRTGSWLASLNLGCTRRTGKRYPHVHLKAAEGLVNAHLAALE